jgi:hypothetical protein
MNANIIAGIASGVLVAGMAVVDISNIQPTDLTAMSADQVRRVSKLAFVLQLRYPLKLARDRGCVTVGELP